MKHTEMWNRLFDLIKNKEGQWNKECLFLSRSAGSLSWKMDEFRKWRIFVGDKTFFESKLTDRLSAFPDLAKLEKEMSLVENALFEEASKALLEYNENRVKQ